MERLIDRVKRNKLYICCSWLKFYKLDTSIKVMLVSMLLLIRIAGVLILLSWFTTLRATLSSISI